MPLYGLLLVFCAALVLIVKGGDLFVGAACWIAEVSGIPRFLIGATIVSVATTLPELLVSLLSTHHGMAEMAIGNAVGSVTANTALILPVMLLFAPMEAPRALYGRKAYLLLAAGAVLLLGCLSGALAGWASIALIGLLALFIVESASIFPSAAKAPLGKGGKDSLCAAPSRPDRAHSVHQVVQFVCGAIWVVVGAHLLVFSASSLARTLGVSERVIAVAMVAVGTSLPELVTAIAALVKRQGSLSAGNIIGANMIDVALILPMCAATAGGTLPISQANIRWDLPVCFAGLCVALVPMLKARRFQRWQGAVLIALYAAYIAFVVA